jgi:hypothetical protein
MNRANAFKAAVVGTLALGALAASAAPAQAQGDRLNLTGSANLSNAPGSGGAELFIDFLLNASTPNPNVPGTITAVETINGAFDPEITPGTTGTIRDLTVSMSGVVGTPVNNFVTIGGYSFTLNSTPEGNTFGPISLVDTGAGTSAFFGVFGTVTGGDFGTTSRNFTGIFTAQFSDMSPDEVFNAVNSGGTLPVGFSAEFSVGSVVPEPSTYLLLGTGIAGLGLFGLRSRRRSTGGVA